MGLIIEPWNSLRKDEHLSLLVSHNSRYYSRDGTLCDKLDSLVNFSPFVVYNIPGGRYNNFQTFVRFYRWLSLTNLFNVIHLTFLIIFQ